MSERESKLFLQDILESIEKIENYVQGLTYEQFVQDNKTFDAVLRNLEVIGEAARRVPATIQTQHPEVPWGQIVALRNRLIHGYFAVDEEIVWDIIVNELPTLRAQIEQILEEANS
ncbi:MAG: DUF86 domain-containing protein [Fimbriimonadales bacterium]|nr:DUF86 domain-containing protein [Fimbriimonadales bacterium]